MHHYRLSSEIAGLIAANRLQQEYKVLAKNDNPKKTKKWLKPIRKMFSKWLKRIRRYYSKWLKPIDNFRLKCSEWVLTHRFTCLIIAVIVGSLLVGNGFPEYFGKLLNINKNSKFIDSFQLLVLGLPVFTLLWFFRTHDTKTQIEKSEKQIEKSEAQIAKSEKQINQASYFKGLDNLASNDLLKTDIGVRQLAALRKITKQYDEDIVIAFRKLFRLRKRQETKGVGNQKIDLGQIDFKEKRNQKIDLKKIDFSEIYLSGAFLFRADLGRINLTRADLSGARFIEADLSEAYLIEADLSGAELDRAKLMRAHLSGTDFSKAKNLETANFQRAFYVINSPPTGIDFEELGYSLEEEIGERLIYSCEEIDGRQVCSAKKQKDDTPIVRLHKKRH